MRYLQFYGLSRTEYDACHAQIEKHNAKISSFLARAGFIGMALLFSVSLCFDELSYFRMTYCIFIFVFFFLSVFTYKKQKRHPVLLLYSICFAYCIFGMLLALPYPDEKPMIIHLIFIVLPLLFIDLPVRVLIYTFSTASVYIVFVTQFLDLHLRFAEIFNTIVLFFIANIIHWIINKDRCLGFLAQIRSDEAMSELQKAQEELRRMSEIDQLTELKNRRKLFETFSFIQLKQISRPDGAFMIDIDHFKELNDRYGHAVGDQFLHQFGTIMLELEKTDHFSVYRYGGEEFAALIWNSSREKLALLANKIRLAAAEIDVGQSECVTVSIGYAFCDDAQILNYERWIDLADQAAYEAKHQGRNKAICWNDMKTHGNDPKQIQSSDTESAPRHPEC